MIKTTKLNGGLEAGRGFLSNLGAPFSRRKGSRVQMHILDSVSLELGDGDRLAVIGASGAGKTSLLRVCAGLMHHSNGVIERSSNPVAMIDLNAGLDVEATGLENIRLRAALMGYSTKITEDLIRHVREYSELEDFIDVPVKFYSSGMLMRLGFSISSFGRADIFILDEWLSVGDAAYQKKTQERLLEKFDDANILIFASHSHEILEKTCNKALWLDRGRVNDFGDAGPILDRYFRASS